MKKIIAVSFMILALSACKKEEKKKAAAKPPVHAPVQKVASLDDLALQSLASPEDWSKDLEIYIDAVMACAGSVPGQTKYVFRADAFENPPIALVLLKTQSDKVFACSIGEDGKPPHFKEIRLSPPETQARFYPGNLPKADSCLTNTRVLDKSGATAGWLAKITCR